MDGRWLSSENNFCHFRHSKAQEGHWLKCSSNSTRSSFDKLSAKTINFRAQSQDTESTSRTLLATCLDNCEKAKLRDLSTANHFCLANSLTKSVAIFLAHSSTSQTVFRSGVGIGRWRSITASTIAGMSMKPICL